MQAARELEKEGITCNITLIFGFIQAVAAAQAGARLISPFPGRIKDWHSANGGTPTYAPEEDPGVVCVRRMYAYYKRYGHEGTICMPASWRPSRGNDDPSYAIDEIVALAGVDRMTIPPPLLKMLAETDAPLPRILEPTVECAAFQSDNTKPWKPPYPLSSTLSVWLFSHECTLLILSARRGWCLLSFEDSAGGSVGGLTVRAHHRRGARGRGAEECGRVHLHPCALVHVRTHG